MLLLVRIFVCIVGVGLLLYAYIDKQNALTELRLQIPQIAKEVKSIQDENHRLEYEIDRFESPIHLMELSRKPEFGHFKYPYSRDIISLPRKKQQSIGTPIEEKMQK